MEYRDFIKEQLLRLAACEGQPDAANVLADFYEEHGQISRADLWRDTERDKRTDGERDRTCLGTLINQSPIDPRRDAMIWILGLTGLSSTTIGRAFNGLSDSRIREIIRFIDREVYFAARVERTKLDPVNRRLRTAKAISIETESTKIERIRTQRTLAIAMPPATWPYTRKHELERKKAQFSLALPTDVKSPSRE